MKDTAEDEMEDEAEEKVPCTATIAIKPRRRLRLHKQEPVLSWPDPAFSNQYLYPDGDQYKCAENLRHQSRFIFKCRFIHRRRLIHQLRHQS